MKKPEDVTDETFERIKRVFNDPNVVALINGVRPLKKQANQEKIIREYLDTARRDLGASKGLHSTGDDANAVFHLQQSVEKLTKAYALYLSYVTLEEAKEVSHYSPQLFFKQLQRIWVPDLMRIIERSYPSFDQGPYKRLGQTVKDFKGRDKKGELARIPREGFDEILKMAKQVGEAINASDSAIQKLPTSFGPRLIEEVTRFGVQHGYPWSRSDIEEAIERIPAMSDQFRLSGEFWRLYILCVVTYSHSTTTRYPGEYLSPSDYREGLGIVDSIKDLWGELERRFAKLEDALN